MQLINLVGSRWEHRKAVRTAPRGRMHESVQDLDPWPKAAAQAAGLAKWRYRSESRVKGSTSAPKTVYAAARTSLYWEKQRGPIAGAESAH